MSRALQPEIVFSLEIRKFIRSEEEIDELERGIDENIITPPAMEQAIARAKRRTGISADLEADGEIEQVTPGVTQFNMVLTIKTETDEMTVTVIPLHSRFEDDIPDQSQGSDLDIFMEEICVQFKKLDIEYRSEENIREDCPVSFVNFEAKASGIFRDEAPVAQKSFELIYSYSGTIPENLVDTIEEEISETAGSDLTGTPMMGLLRGNVPVKAEIDTDREQVVISSPFKVIDDIRNIDNTGDNIQRVFLDTEIDARIDPIVTLRAV